ncbi:MAG: hypothetical protein K6F68_08185 [Clostridiales bacterium]|nr:hypothetical protein [Clostridiales bacterium]
MKKAMALFLALAALFALTACARKAETGKMIKDNIARVYTPGTRESFFVKNGEMLAGSVVGKLFFTTAADGNSALGWVDTVLYFIDEKGPVLLGTGISTAEISLDGRLALYVMENDLYMYSRDTRESKVVDSGIDSIYQFAVSPHSGCVMFTATYQDAPEELRTKLYKDGTLTTVIEKENSVVMAVTDDANRFWYSDMSGSLIVSENGQKKTVATGCGAGSNYNFTVGLDEVTFTADDDTQYFYRLRDDKLIKLGTGFGYTLKTDLFSISDVTVFCYINDVETFTNGLFLFDPTDGNVYSVGYIDGDGKLTMLLENALKYKIAPDASKIFWLGPDNSLYETVLNGKATLLAKDVNDFGITEDGTAVYYIAASGSLFKTCGTRSDKLDTGVSKLAVFRSYCAYIKDVRSDKGTLFYTVGGESVKLMENAVRFEERKGQLLVYTDPAESNGSTLYTLYISEDGKTFHKIKEGVEP